MDNEFGTYGKLKDVKKQSAFCGLLMEKLHKDVLNVKTCGYAIEGRTRIQKDIIKLRRELNDLNKLLDCRWFE